MKESGYKIKYFKDTIIGMRARITYNHITESLNGQDGTIQTGKGVHRFSIQLDKQIKIDGKNLNSFFLVEEDEIILLPE